MEQIYSKLFEYYNYMEAEYCLNIEMFQLMNLYIEFQYI